MSCPVRVFAILRSVINGTYLVPYFSAPYELVGCHIDRRLSTLGPGDIDASITLIHPAAVGWKVYDLCQRC